MDYRKILESLRPEGFENVKIVVLKVEVHKHQWITMSAPNYGFISFGDNYGNVQIYNQLAALENSPSGREIGSALKEFLAAVDLSSNLPQQQKQELLENVGTLIQQAQSKVPAKGLVRSAWHFIRDNVGPAKDLLESAEALRKLLGSFFGIDT